MILSLRSGFDNGVHGVKMEKKLNSEQINSLSAADSLVDKGKLYFEHGRFDEAKGFYKQALDKRSSVLGKEDPAVAEAMHGLGRCMGELKEYEDAYKEFVGAVEIYEKFFYDAHFDLGPVLLDHASYLMREGKWEEAEPICLRAQQIFSKTLSGEHKLNLEATYRLAIIYRKNGKQADALKLFVRIKKVLESPYGPSEEFKYLEALIQEDQNKPKEAEASFIAAINGFEKRRNLPRLADCLRSYAELLTKQGLKDKAEALVAKAEEYEEKSAGLSYSGAIFTSTLLKA